MKSKFNNKKLTKKGEEYEGYAKIMDDIIGEGYPKKDVIAAINYIGELESMDLGDEIRVFLDGVEYGKKKRKKK